MFKKILILTMIITHYSYAFAKDTLEFSCDTPKGRVTISSTPKKSHYIYRFYQNNGTLALEIKQTAKKTSQYSRYFYDIPNLNGSNMYFQNGYYGYHVRMGFSPINNGEDVSYHADVSVERLSQENLDKLSTLNEHDTQSVRIMYSIRASSEMLHFLECIKINKIMSDEHLFRYMK